MARPLDSVQWIHGASDCPRNIGPLIQVHELDGDTFIMRLNKCFSYEGNFIYLLFGSGRAILFDTGGPPDAGSSSKVLPLRDEVEKIVTRWLQSRGIQTLDLIVAHTHSDGDHVFWDRQFAGRPGTIVVEPTLAAVKSFFGLPNWPEGEAYLDLGGRILTVFPIPGHESTHIAVYDACTKALLTGDLLYPGLLTVRDWIAYRRSAARLADFARHHAISLVLGNHIEMKKTPRELYPVGTTYQPNEHSLPLGATHIAELHAACEAMANSPHLDVHDDFVIQPPGCGANDA
jgi:glyoxylase-like metal-dependent hydrolase (beta-lactamase superfamily II)